MTRTEAASRHTIFPLLLACVSACLPAPLAAQQFAGLVVEQGTLAPVSDAIVTLLRVNADGETAPAGTTVTDAEGVFVYDGIPAGDYILAADRRGLSSPWTPALTLGEGEVNHDVVLVLPSRLIMMASACDLEANPGTILVGVVRDAETEVPLPGASVTVRPEAGEGRDQPVPGVDFRAETDVEGRYLLCGLPVDGILHIRAESLGRTGDWGAIELSRPTLVLHDLELNLGARAIADAGPEAETVLQAASGSVGDLRGRLSDRESAAPIVGAIVRIRDGELQAVTDAEGRFAFPAIRPDDYVLEIQHLGYSVQSSEVSVPEGQDVHLRLRLSPRAVELAEVEVTVRSVREQAERISSFRRGILSGEILAEEEARGAAFTEVLRRHMTGLRVREHYTEYGTRLCIETNRRIQSIREEECRMVEIVMDGVRLVDDEFSPVADFVRGMSLHEIESMEYLTPLQAGSMYGVGGNVANGVLVIYTRGKGPFRSTERDPG